MRVGLAQQALAGHGKLRECLGATECERPPAHTPRTHLVDVELEGPHGAHEDVDTAIELAPVEQEWPVDVLLGHGALQRRVLGDVLGELHEVDVAAHGARAGLEDVGGEAAEGGGAGAGEAAGGGGAQGQHGGRGAVGGALVGGEVGGCAAEVDISCQKVLPLAAADEVAGGGGGQAHRTGAGAVEGLEEELALVGEQPRVGVEGEVVGEGGLGVGVRGMGGCGEGQALLHAGGGGGDGKWWKVGAGG